MPACMLKKLLVTTIIPPVQTGCKVILPVCVHAQYHPDRLGGECSSRAESGVKKFLEVDAAWRILSDQNNRRQYDLQRRGKTSHFSLLCFYLCLYDSVFMAMVKICVRNLEQRWKILTGLKILFTF